MSSIEGGQEHSADLGAASKGEVGGHPIGDGMSQNHHAGGEAGYDVSPDRQSGPQSCPSCGGASLTSVRALFEQGTSITSVSSVGGAVVVDGTGDPSQAMTRLATTFAKSSVLAQRLAPPEQPLRREPFCARLHGYGVLGALLPIGLWFVAMATGNAGGSATWGWTTLIWLLVVVATAFPVAKMRNRTRLEYQWRMKCWERQLSEWAELRYCSSCDYVIDPRTGKKVPADKLHVLLQAA